MYGYALVVGRNPVNCQRHEVAQALGDAGHNVAALACGTPDKPCCPHRQECAYWQQFEAPGPRVGAVEQLFNPAFLAGGSLAVVDDADLGRALIERHFLTPEQLVQTHKLLHGKKRQPLRDLLVALTAAVMEAPKDENGIPRRLTGASVWDHFVRAGGRWDRDFVALVQALPASPTLPAPKPGA